MNKNLLTAFRKEDLERFLEFIVDFNGTDGDGNWVEGINIDLIRNENPIIANINDLQFLITRYLERSQ